MNIFIYSTHCIFVDVKTNILLYIYWISFRFYQYKNIIKAQNIMDALSCFLEGLFVPTTKLHISRSLTSLVMQCPARVGFGQSRSEKWRKNVIHSFREVQVKKNDLRSRSRNESEMKMTENRDREVKVKWKSFEIEIEKWNFSRIFENLKRTDFDLSERVHLEVISFLYVIC